jgi:starch synthase
VRVALLTREYPPEVYGGAGVAVEYLARELDQLPGVDVDVHCFGAPRSSPLVKGAYQPWADLPSSAPHDAALRTLSVDLQMAARVGEADIAHSHTWYANLAGHLAKLVHGIPHVVTTHSLEPLRPWKAEQLGGGYALSSWCEKTGLENADAVIAVSSAMRDDILACYPDIDPARVVVIHNGVDTDEFHPVETVDALTAHGIDPDRPSIVFVGRITRQKGIDHLLAAVPHIDPAAQIVFLPSSPDTPELGREMRALAGTAAQRGSVLWIEEVLGRPQLVQVLSQATAFVCPSVYEPFGLVNVEAMACGAAVVASAVGGIPEIVVEDVTGHLVPFEPTPDGTRPVDPEAFVLALAAAINKLLADPAKAAEMGRAGRERVLERFSWEAIATRTAALYESLIA